MVIFIVIDMSQRIMHEAIYLLAKSLRINKQRSKEKSYCENFGYEVSC